MYNWNLRGYFGPETTIDGNANEDELIAILRRAMDGQRWLQSGEYRVSPTSTPRGNGESQRDMLASLYPRGGDSNARAHSAQLDPNFRQLARLSSVARSPGGMEDAEYNVETSPNYSRDQGGATDTGQPSTEGTETLWSDGKRPAPVTAGFSRFGVRPPPTSIPPGMIPPISTPAIPEWWSTAAKLFQILPRGMYGGGSGGRNAYNRCIRAAEGNTEDWNDFCRYLERDENNTLGGESQNRACWSKAFESEAQKKQWCENQFRRR